MNNSKNKKDLLGKGSYGCIIRPNFSCNKYNTTTKYISKLGNKEYILSEMKTINALGIDKIPNFNKYVLVPLEICDLNKSFINKKVLEKDIRNCIIKLPSYTKNATVSNIIQEYGGISYQDYKKNNKTLEDNIPYIYQLLQSIKFLNDNGIVHRDIKDNNMVIDIKRKLARIIDFGFGMFSNEINNLYNTNNILIGSIEVYGSGYEIWPMELYIFSNFYKGDDLIKISKSVFMNYYNSYIAFFPKEDIKTFKKHIDKELLEINKKVTQINNSSNKDKLIFEWKNESNNKLDVFSFGKFLLGEIQVLHSTNEKLVNDFKKFIYEKLLIMNSYKRVDIDKCIKLFTNICKVHKVSFN
jgi:serine/threonine protein kinase